MECQILQYSNQSVGNDPFLGKIAVCYWGAYIVCKDCSRKCKFVYGRKEAQQRKFQE